MARVDTERVGDVAIVRLNRPNVLNAIDQAMWRALLEAFRCVAEDRTARACIVTGNGRAFCSGADLNETPWHGETPEQSRERVDAHNQQLAREIVALPCPVIACINGYAIGGGAEIALAADIRIAARGAEIGFPEAVIGRFVTGGASLLLARAVGLSQAKRMLFTGERVDTERALQIGLCDEVTPPEELLPRGLALARRIAASSSLSVSLMKRVLDRLALRDLEAALELETDAIVATYAEPAIDDAARAFRQRR